VVSAKIRSADVPVLRRGQRADESPGRPDTSDRTAAPSPSAAAATVSYISPAVDSSTDTVLVRASLPSQSAVRPGQFVTVRILYAEHRNRLAVPADSVVTDEGGRGASIAIVSDNVAVRHPVTVGLADNGLVEVDGPDLREGSAIVASGAYGLPDKTRIRPIAP
jgi:multidrug efflux pump subunit AcrA (membrane-fusion protein)